MRFNQATTVGGIVLMLAMALLSGSAGPAAQVPQAPALDRTVLPIPDPPFQGRIGITYKDSVADKMRLVRPPAGAPNVLLILLDDAGYGQTGTFGGLIPTPELDRLAAGGLRYTRFHVTGMCSPTRAALLTGRNHHAVGMGIITNFSTGFPGYNGWIPKSAALVSEVLRQNGYATAAIGKWHLIPDWETGPSGPFDHWPTRQGFEYYYGFLGGQTNQWTPSLVEGESFRELQVPPGRESDYTLNEALADKAIAWINTEKSNHPDRPFFMYFAPGAVHAPLQAPKAWIDRFKGTFDMGWDRYREMVFDRQKKLGVIPPDAKLTPRPAEIPSWDSLTPERRKVAARLMEVFAGFYAQTDYEIGRVIDAIRQTGNLDNTLILYVAGDNGASLEGDVYGCFDDMAVVNGVAEDTGALVRKLDDFGGPRSYVHYPIGWAWAGNTPFQWGKQIAAFFGGTRDPLVVHWPKAIKTAGGIRTQFHHVIDLVPTILDAAGLPRPTSVNGVAQTPLDGVSMLYSFDDPGAAERRSTQYFEIFAHRAIYHDGWVASAMSGRLPWVPGPDPDVERQPWHLYNVAADYSEADDLAAKEPAKLKQLKDLFTAEGRRNQVFPLDPRPARADSSLRPSLTEGRQRYVYYAGAGRLLQSLAPPTVDRSHTISARITIPPGRRAEGVIVAQGGLGAGFTLYLRDGRPVYTYRYFGEQITTIAAAQQLPPGPALVKVEFAYDGGGPGKGATVTLFVNGTRVDQARLARTVPVTYSYDETFDVGADTGMPVGDYRAPFQFSGVIQTVEIDAAPQGLSSADRAMIDRKKGLAETRRQ